MYFYITAGVRNQEVVMMPMVIWFYLTLAAAVRGMPQPLCSQAASVSVSLASGCVRVELLWYGMSEMRRP